MIFRYYFLELLIVYYQIYDQSVCGLGIHLHIGITPCFVLTLPFDLSHYLNIFKSFFISREWEDLMLEFHGSLGFVFGLYWVFHILGFRLLWILTFFCLPSLVLDLFALGYPIYWCLPLCL